MKLVVSVLLLIGSAAFAYDFKEPSLQLTAEQLKNLCQDSSQNLLAKMETLSKIPDAQINASNFLIPFEQAITAHKSVTEAYRVFQYTKPEGMDLSATVKEFCAVEVTSVFQKSDLARKMNLVSVTPDSEESFLKDFFSRQFEWNGAYLDEASRQRLLSLKAEILDAKNNFYQRQAPMISFSKAELAGISSEEINQFQVNESGEILVPASWNLDYLSQLSIESSRKKYLENILRQHNELTIGLIQKSAYAKLKAARLLGFDSWVDFKIRYMAFSDKEKTLQLVDQINHRLTENTKKDLAILADFKKEIDPTSGPLQLWDIDFLNNKWLQKNRNLDLNKVSEYFPVRSYSEKLFAFFGKLFGLRFEEQTDKNVWHPSVRKFAVYDKASNQALGLIYFDIAAYSGKSPYSVSANSLARYPHDVNGVRQPGLCSLQASFVKEGKALISHGQAVQLAHELGHCIHSLTYTGKYASLAFPMADFLELPSQMLEFFLWSKEGLQALTGHVDRPEEAMPEEMMTQLIASNTDSRGFFQTLYALNNETDLAMHSITREEYDPVQNQCELFTHQFGLADQIICQTPPAYGHFMHEGVTGYAGSYYSYDLDLALAKDLFKSIKKSNFANENSLREYRTKVLEAGASKRPLDLLKDFLGREPHID